MAASISNLRSLFLYGLINLLRGFVILGLLIWDFTFVAPVHAHPAVKIQPVGSTKNQVHTNASIRPVPWQEDVIDPLPNVSGTRAGFLPGQLSVTETGTARYEMPIELSPGTNGLKPTLKLVYDSRSQNGPLGMGWSLGGLSSIARCQATLEQDGFVGAVRFDSDDRFCLDGQRLKVLGGDLYGESNAEYGLENEEFSRIRSSGTAGTGPAEFEVNSKDGLTFYYGTTEDSRIEAQGVSEVFIWRLARVKDSFGNYFTVTYHEDNELGESYPIQLDYTGNEGTSAEPYNSVELLYEERADSFPKYLSGSRFQLTKRLSSIVMKNDGTESWRYELSYEELMHGTSLLESVSFCDVSGECLPATNFFWKTSVQEFGESIPWHYGTTNGNGNFPVYQSQPTVYTDLIDMDGDGLLDRVSHKGLFGESSSDFYVYRNTGSGFGPGEVWQVGVDTTLTYARYAGNSGIFTDLMDVTGDGLPDRISYRGIQNEDADAFFVYRNNGNGFDPGEMWYDSPISGSYDYPLSSNNGGGNAFTNLVDMDGDGLPDRVSRDGIFGEPSNKFYVYRQNGSGFDDAVVWYDSTVDNTFDNPRYGNSSSSYHDLIDINGDSLPDRVTYRAFLDDDRRGLIVYPNTGYGFSESERWYESWDETWDYPFYGGTESLYTTLIDMNGDGLLDRVAYRDFRSGDNTNQLTVYLNRGKFNGVDGFTEGVIWQEGPNASTSYPRDGGGSGRYTDLIDMNGDNLPDRVSYYDYMGSQQDGFTVYLNTGAGFTEGTIWYTASNSWKDYPSHRDGNGIYTDLLDMNGDGLPDRVAHRDILGDDSSGFTVYLNQMSTPLLERVEDGIGKTTSVEYSYASDSSVHQKDVGSVYPVQDMGGPLPLVKRYTESDGLGGEQGASYFYEGLKFSTTGRGFCGFRRITVTDEASGMSTVTSYHQEHPLKTMPYLVETYVADGTLVSRSEDTWETRELSDGRYFNYVRYSEAERFELDGHRFERTSTEKEYDEFGSVTRIEIVRDDGFRTITTNEYLHNLARWHLGKVERSTVQHKATAQFPITKHSSFEYDSITGALRTERTEPDHPTLSTTKRYFYDDFGNIQKTIRTTPLVAEPRETTTEYDQRGQFVVSTTNQVGHTSLEQREALRGNLVSATSASGQTKVTHYDSFGRKLKEIHPHGTETRELSFLVEENDENAPDLAIYYVRLDASGVQKPVLKYFDLLGREIRTLTSSFDGELIAVDKVYNARGEVSRVSEPYFLHQTPIWTEMFYDDLGRVVRVESPGSASSGGELRVTETLYDGYETTVIDPLLHEHTRIVNSLGKLTETIDNIAESVYYLHDAMGRVVGTYDTNFNGTSVAFDVNGNPIEADDLSLGYRTYEYNGYGELLSEMNAAGEQTTYTYDALGRMTSRSSPEGVDTFEYDLSPYAKGSLSRTISSDGEHEELIIYDQHGRVKQTRTWIDGELFQRGTFYDQYGRTKRLNYPGGFSVEQNYSQHNGELISVKNTTSHVEYWRLLEQTARGKVAKFEQGNGVVTTRSFDSGTGYLESITTGTSYVQDLTFTFDPIGNLLSRTDYLISKTEEFEYDEMNRLTRAEVLGGPDLPTEVEYDSLGNIRYMRGVGDYYYQGVSPHAVTSISGALANTYTYDAKGNRVADLFGTASYTSFNKPLELTKGGAAYRYSYSADRDRYRVEIFQDDILQRRKIYVGKLFEREESDTQITFRNYIASGDGVIAVVEKTSGVTTEHYLHKDHLGSIQALTNDLGDVVETLSFDAWGNRRNAEDWTRAQAPIASGLERGFTGHEMLDELALVHMNGRVYDPTIGRFLSPDPFVQSPDNSQNLNRYSYVLNNPLSYTDPSGFFFKKLFKWVKKFFKKYKAVILATAAAVVVGAWASSQILGALSTAQGASAGALFAAGVGGGAAGGFASSLAGVLVNGGEIGEAFKEGLRGGFFGALSGGIFEKIGASRLAGFRKTLAHGVAGGGVRVAQGGKFHHGFISSFANQHFSREISFLDQGTRGVSAIRAAASATLGGSVSALSGGNFANGAITSAFARMYNDDFHEKLTVKSGATAGDLATTVGLQKYPKSGYLFGLNKAFSGLGLTLSFFEFKGNPNVWTGIEFGTASAPVFLGAAGLTTASTVAGGAGFVAFGADMVGVPYDGYNASIADYIGSALYAPVLHAVYGSQVANEAMSDFWSSRSEDRVYDYSGVMSYR